MVLTENETNRKFNMILCIEWMKKYNKIFTSKDQFEINSCIEELKEKNTEEINNIIEQIKNYILVDLELEVLNDFHTNHKELIPLTY